MTSTPHFVLPDLCDEFSDRMQIAAPVFRHFGGRHVFSGPILTISCFEDNSLVADRVREAGAGAVLVVDGGASLRCALVGDNLARLAADHGWAGIVVSASRYEPFGLAALEGARSGAPLVLSDIATYRELWRGAALFFNPQDPDDLARCINRLARDEKLRAEMGLAQNPVA